MDPENIYVSEKVVSRVTGDALSTLRNNRHLGRGLPYIKNSRSIRYSLRDVISYMEARKIVPKGD